jgi:D-3-phosphoglycerate dehydrogenase
VLIRERTKIRAPLLERLPNLRLISQRSVYPHIDIDACIRLGVIVSSSQHAGHAILCGGRAHLGIGARGDAPDPAADGVAQGRTWQIGVGTTLRKRPLASMAMAVSAKSLRAMARPFGMDVLVWARPDTLKQARADGYGTAASKEAFFETCDIISLHMRLVPATRHIVTAATSRA